MALEDSLILLRHLIDDTDSSSYTYTDDRLIELLYVSSSYVNLELGTEYTINICSQTITPNTDATFETLSALKASCLLVRGTQSSYSKNDFSITDGPSTVSLKGASGQLKISADGFCIQYEKAKNSYLMGNITLGGGYAISTPSSES